MTWPWWTCDDQYDNRGTYLRLRMELFTHNRRLAAEREAWPAGTLEACERLDAEYPGWAVTWLPANPMPGLGRPPRWMALMPEDRAYLVAGLQVRRPRVFALTAAELAERIVETEAEMEAAQAERDGWVQALRRGVG